VVVFIAHASNWIENVRCAFFAIGAFVLAQISPVLAHGVEWSVLFPNDRVWSVGQVSAGGDQKATRGGTDAIGALVYSVVT